MYAKVLEAPVPRTSVTATAAVPVSAPLPAVAKGVDIVAITPEKSAKIETPSPTSVSGNMPLVVCITYLISTLSPVSLLSLKQSKMDLWPADSTPSHLFFPLQLFCDSLSEAIEEPVLDTTATATHITTLFDSEDDWQVVTKKDFYDGDSSTESKDGTFEESSAETEELEEPTEVEADLIDQIRAMFIEQSGRKATVFEEKEWLKNIRDVTEKVDEEEETTI